MLPIIGCYDEDEHDESALLTRTGNTDKKKRHPKELTPFWCGCPIPYL